MQDMYTTLIRPQLEYYTFLIATLQEKCNPTSLQGCFFGTEVVEGETCVSEVYKIMRYLDGFSSFVVFPSATKPNKGSEMQIN